MEIAIFEDKLCIINSNTIKARYVFIDILKSIGIFLVTAYHFGYQRSFLENGSVLNYIAYFFTAFSSVCVPVFFAVNGFLLFSRPFSAKKHCARIIKLFAAFLIFGTLTVLSLTLIRGDKLGFAEFLKSLFTLKQDMTNHFWFIYLLLAIYAAFPMLKRIFDRNFKCFLVFTAALGIFDFGFKAVAIIKYIYGGLSNSSEREPLTHINFFIYPFVYFCVGGILSRILEKLLKISHRKAKASLLLIASSALWFIISVIISKLGGAVYDAVWNGYNSVFTLINTVALFLLPADADFKRKKGILQRLIATVADNTLGVYFLHWILIFALRRFVFEGLSADIVYSLPIRLAASLVIVLVTALLSAALKKLKPVKYIL